MKRILLLVTISAFSIAIWISSCVHKPQIIITPANGNYPDSIASILITKCAGSGCHNSKDYAGAGKLNLDTWEHMFQGCSFGAVAVPYSSTYSSILYYANPDSTLGTKVYDPAHKFTPLTTAEYYTLFNWIAHGSPDRDGNIPFASNADTRQKIYLTQSGSNLVAVIDAKSKLVMRYIPVGGSGNGSQHDLEISADGRYAYNCFYAGNLIEKIDTRTDTVIGAADLSSLAVAGQAGWSILYLSPQDTALMVSGYYNGYLTTINTSSLSINHKMTENAGFGSGLIKPHGITGNASFDTFFVTEEFGNVVERITFNCTGGYCATPISIDGKATTWTSVPGLTPDPHQVEMAPDESKYYVSCQNTGEVRVMDAHADTLIKVITVGAWPQEMAVCESKHYLFVACSLDRTNAATGKLGTVFVIDYTTDTVVKILNGDFYGPHDIAVDNQDGLLYIASQNNFNGGIPAHHCIAGSCNAGWYTVYDLNTLAPADNIRYQVALNPYAIAPRF